MMKLKALIVMAALITITACSKHHTRAVDFKSSSDTSPVVHKLHQHYSQWQGVRYKEGGMTKDGVDCSGYVFLTYKNKFNKNIPRSTELLSRYGKEIQPGQIMPGDLVFFKTGWKTRHVGIYINDGKFMHASSSRGVMISNLNNPYWSDAFWMARKMH
ncbi:MAG TPA: NlpC/P60 family protein [Gammaproteobacteria bacterium]